MYPEYIIDYIRQEGVKINLNCEYNAEMCTGHGPSTSTEVP